MKHLKFKELIISQTMKCVFIIVGEMKYLNKEDIQTMIRGEEHLKEKIYPMVLTSISLMMEKEIDLVAGCI